MEASVCGNPLMPHSTAPRSGAPMPDLRQAPEAGGGGGRDTLEGKGPQRWSMKRLDRRLEEVTKAVGGGYCRLQMPVKRAVAIRQTVAGRRLGALERGGGGVPPPPSNASLWGVSPWGCRITTPPLPH